MTSFENESRLIREATSLLSRKVVDKVIVVALWEKGLESTEYYSENIQVLRLKLVTRAFPKSLPFQLIKYFELLVRVVAICFKESVIMINCHALASLPIGVVSRCVGVRAVIYDAHELETERNGLSGLRKKLSKLLENIFIKAADIVLVPGYRIRSWYRRCYGIDNVVTILNSPDIKSVQRTSVLREEFSISDESRIFLYHGNLSAGRGLESTLAAFAKINCSNFTLVIMGYGPLENLVKDYQRKFSGRIFLKPPVPPEQVVDIAASADIGLCLIEPVCLSYEFCLPNKLFEYRAAGIPIIASRLPEIEEVLQGWPSCLVPTASVYEIELAVKKMVFEKARSPGLSNLEGYQWKDQEDLLVDTLSFVKSY